MKTYSEGIMKPGILDTFLKPKTWVMNRIQYYILEYFGKHINQEEYTRRITRIARRWIGGYMYSIKIEINEECTLNCKMCYVKDSGNELSFEQIKKLLDQIKNYKIRLEIMGGEPLIRSDITNIISYAKAKAKVPFVSLYTNGIHITHELAEKLKGTGLDAIIISLISHKPGIHNKFTGQDDSWEKCIEGIKICRDSGLRTYTFTPIHKENYPGFQNLYHFVKHDLKVHALFYQYIPQSQSDPLIIDPELWHKIKQWILVKNNQGHAKFVRNFFMISGNACSGGHFVLTVKADGTVQPCPFISNMPLGNIKNESIWKIYKNRFKAPGFVDFKATPEECGECTYSSVCSGGCKAGNDKIYDRYCHMDHRCMGPYSEEFNPEKIIDKIPSFF